MGSPFSWGPLACENMDPRICQQSVDDAVDIRPTFTEHNHLPHQIRLRSWYPLWETVQFIIHESVVGIIRDEASAACLKNEQLNLGSRAPPQMY